MTDLSREYAFAADVLAHARQLRLYLLDFADDQLTPRLQVSKSECVEYLKMLRSEVMIEFSVVDLDDLACPCTEVIFVTGSACLGYCELMLAPLDEVCPP